MKIVNRILGADIKGRKLINWETEIDEGGTLIIRCNGTTVFVVYEDSGCTFWKDRLELEKLEVTVME